MYVAVVESLDTNVAAVYNPGASGRIWTGLAWSCGIAEGHDGKRLLKALVYTKPYHFEYTDVPDPSVGDEEVLIRVRACGVCGSDVHGCTGQTGRRIPPLIMGHEAAGTIEKLGRAVQGLAVGQRVCFDSTVYCNKCPACRQGLYNRCHNRRVLGVSTPEFKRDGAFAEYVSVPWWIVCPIPDDMSFVQAAMLEPVSIAMHAVNRCYIRPGDYVLVIGTGTIGLLVLQVAKLKAPVRVLAADINPFRLDLAGKLGADQLIDPGAVDLVEAVQDATEGRGVDVSFEAVGYADTFWQAAASTRIGGAVVAVGNLEKTVRIDLQQLVAKELTITGSYASAGEFRAAIEPVARRQIDVMSLVSDVVPLKEGSAAFERLLKRGENLIKIVLEP